jgi:hypothetical protein
VCKIPDSPDFRAAQKTVIIIWINLWNFGHFHMDNSQAPDESAELKERSTEELPPQVSPEAKHSQECDDLADLLERERAHVIGLRGTMLRQLIHDDDLFGLALSGGGIRSATFSLGVLQALAHRSWLHQIDYLSTVSGGGFIGSWLSACIYHTQDAHKKDRGGENASLRGQAAGIAGSTATSAAPQIDLLSSCQDTTAIDAVREIEHQISPKNIWLTKEGIEPDLIKSLRSYSSYLTPHLGLPLKDSDRFSSAA